MMIADDIADDRVSTPKPWRAMADRYAKHPTIGFFPHPDSEYRARKKRMENKKPLDNEEDWWARQDSNLRPTDYESAALTN